MKNIKEDPSFESHRKRNLEKWEKFEEEEINLSFEEEKKKLWKGVKINFERENIKFERGRKTPIFETESISFKKREKELNCKIEEKNHVPRKKQAAEGMETHELS